MNTEGLSHLPTNEEFTQKERFHMREQIQLALINKYYGFPVTDNAHLVEWIRIFAADYSTAFNETCRTNPTFLTLYKNNPEEALNQIEEELQRIHAHTSETKI